MATPNHVPTYNLKAVIQETGLKPDTLRAWERRYGLPQPQRTAGGHRLYSQHDIDLLKWLVARQEEGLSISRAVDLWQTLQAEGQDPLQMAAPAPASLPAGNTITEMRRAWVAACLAFDERSAEHILAQASALYPLESVCFELLQKGLAQIGEGWYNGETTVQQEHFASALAMRRLEAFVTVTPPSTRPGRILVGCPSEEEHTFSALLLTLLLRRHGWEVIYLGANVPTAHLAATIDKTKPDLVILPAQQLHAAATLLEVARLLQGEGMPLAYGGLIFNRLPALQSHIPGHFLGERLEQSPQLVERLLLSPHAVPLAAPLPAESQLKEEVYRPTLAHYQEQQAAVEAQVWQLMKAQALPTEALTSANTKFAQNIIAALKLGNIEFASPNITWIEGYFINYHLPTVWLNTYLTIYYQAARMQLDERGKPIIDWLAQLAAQEETQGV